MKGNKSLRIGLICLFLLLCMMFAGPLLPWIDPELTEYSYRYDEEGKLMKVPFPPSKENPLGSDGQGRDLLSLIVLGTKETVWLIFVIALVRYLIALPLSVMSFYSKRGLSWVLLKWNQMLTNVPTLFMVLLLINIPLIVLAEHRTLWVILLIALIEVGRVSYIFQQQLIQISKSPAIEAGIMVGNGPFGLMRKYYWPQIFPQILVNFSLDLGKVMLLLGQLGFLSIFIAEAFITYDVGIGMLVNQSNNWPQLLASAREYIRTYLWIPFWPSLMIAFTVFTFNILGEGLRQHFEHSTSSRYNAKLEKKVINEIKTSHLSK